MSQNAPRVVSQQPSSVKVVPSEKPQNDARNEKDDAPSAEATTQESETPEKKDGAPIPAIDRIGADNLTDADIEAALRSSAKDDEFARAEEPVKVSAGEEKSHMAELVPILPRRSVGRVSISGQWVTLRKGVEQFVPRSVAHWLKEHDLV